MQFRWVAVITLWTFLIGPVMAPPSSHSQLATATGRLVVKTK